MTSAAKCIQPDAACQCPPCARAVADFTAWMEEPLPPVETVRKGNQKRAKEAAWQARLGSLDSA